MTYNSPHFELPLTARLSAADVPYKFLAGMTLGPGNVRQS